MTQDTPTEDVPSLLRAAGDRMAAGDLEGAEALARRATAVAPALSEPWNALGVVLRRGDRLAEAAQAYGEALDRDPDNGRAWRNLALCHQAMERPVEAAQALQNALRLGPDAPDLLHLLAMSLHDARDFAGAAAAYRRFLEASPGDVRAITDLGMVLLELGRDDDAMAEFEKALALHPGYPPAEFGLRETIVRLVPPWHVPMMNEPKRNLAYREAIRAVVRPTDKVLEIGTGAGLLSLMAAEAGAAQVTTCEMVGVVAEEAQAIVARSPWAERIKVVPKKSTQLRLGEDLDERADVLVSEILANDFVGEGVMPSLIDAKRRLLKPGARVIPSRGAFMGVLVGGAEVEYLLGLKDVCGFDVASFAKFKPWRQAIAWPLDYAALSDDIALLDYDFTDLDSLAPVDTVIPVTVTADGLCWGVLQWIRLELSPGITYDNHPRTTRSVWNKMLYAFPEPIAVTVGETVGVRLWQRGDYLYLTSA